MFKAREYLLLFVILVLVGGCSQANTRGNETVRTYNITVHNEGQSDLRMTMPLNVDAITTESLEQDVDNDPATEMPISAALQGGQATTAAKGATQNADLVSDYKEWQDFRKYQSDNDNRVTPPVVVPIEPTNPPVVTPTEPEESVLIEKGDYKGRSDGRPFWNFSKAMKEYPETFRLAVKGCAYVNVTNDGVRWESAPDGYVVKQSDKPGWNTAVIGPTSCKSESALFLEKVSTEPTTSVDPPLDTPLDLVTLGAVKWLHTSVSGWPVTAKLGSVSITSSTTSLPYNKWN